MKILKKYRLGEMQNNAYLIQTNKKTVLIDAPKSIDKVKLYLQENNLILNEIWITHAHFDHFLGLEKINGLYPDAKIYAPLEELTHFKLSKYNLSEVMPNKCIFDKEIISLDEVEKDNSEVKISYISGHSLQSAIFIFENEKIIFSGDTLFYETIGRSDLLFGSTAKLTKGIIEKIYKYNENFKIYPGHGFETTLEHEKENNKVLKNHE